MATTIFSLILFIILVPLSPRYGLISRRRTTRALANREHHLSEEQANALAAQLGHPTHDPHGDAIPTAGGVLMADKGEPLNALAVDQSARITHIEDELKTIYAQLAAEGLRPGMKVRVLEKSPQATRFWASASLAARPDKATFSQKVPA